jgi:sulfotransferase
VEFIEAILDRKVKILVPVRSLSEVIASMERLHRKTQEVKSPPGENSHFFQMQTLEGRIDYWLRQDSVVGLALNRIQDVIARGLRDRIHFIDFDVLTTNPAQVMSSVYDFLGEVPFPHDFTNVEQKTSEDDTIFGYVGLHKIRPAVTPVPKYAPFILGKQLTARLNGINVPWQ